MKNSNRSVVAAFSVPFALLAAVGFAMQASAAPAKVVWAKSYEAAVQEAKKTKKPIFIDFYTDWCSPCKELDKKTFVDPKFVAASRKWVMLKVNPERSDAEFKLATKYKAMKFPTGLMLTASGRKLDSTLGFYPAPALVAKMTAALKKNR